MSILKKIFRSVVFTCSVLTSSLSLAGPGIDNIAVFGDSLSDQGAWYALTGGAIPKAPYYKGRFSNGPIWVDYLADALGFNPDSIDQYAVGGATVKFGVPFFDPSSVLFDLSGEVSFYHLNHLFDSRGDWHDRLYIIWAGANDYWDRQDQGSVEEVINIFFNNVEYIMDQGGRYFLLPNMAIMSASPYATSHGLSEGLQKALVYHNQLFHQRIENLKARYTDAVIVELDIPSMMSQVDPSQFNMEPCYKGDYMGNGDVVGFIGAKNPMLSASFKRLSPDVQEHIKGSVPLRIAMNVSANATLRSAIGDDVANKCFGRFFWDEVHPTTFVHSLLGRAAADILINQYGFHRD